LDHQSVAIAIASLVVVAATVPWPAPQYSQSRRVTNDAHAAFPEPRDSRSSGKSAELPEPQVDVFLMGHAP